MDPWFENFKLMLTYWLMSNRDPTMAEAALTSRMAQPYLQSVGIDMQASSTSNQNSHGAANFPIPTSVHHRPQTPPQYHRQDSGQNFLYFYIFSFIYFQGFIEALYI